MSGYHKNSMKILHSNPKCWLLWSSSSLLCVFVLDCQLQSPTPKWPLRSLTPDWLMSFVLLFTGFCGDSSLGGLHTKIDKERSSWHPGTTSKIPEITSPLWSPIHEHTQTLTHIHPYIYIHTRINAHYRAIPLCTCIFLIFVFLISSFLQRIVTSNIILEV